jgi:nucleotide-binding universal stress UspA family protein
MTGLEYDAHTASMHSQCEDCPYSSAAVEGMMIKDLLVNIATGIHEDASLDFAFSLARMFDAHVTGMAFAYEVVPVAMLLDDVPPVWIEDFRKDAEKAAKDAVARFQETARRAGIAVDARWMAATFAETAEIFGRMGRRFDLTVVRQAEPATSTPAPLIIEAALFDTGRPALVIPYIQKGEIRLDRIMVCWDGSRSAARAASDALPLLQRAKMVELVTVAEQGKHNELAGADIAQHLARHGLAVEARQIVSQDARPVDVILSHAADSSADLLVMGGFGHSRLREFVLGGVTRSILESMTVPVLMAH